MIEPWFIPFDIVMIIGLTLAVILALIFICFIIFDKTCHTVPMMLIANSCLSELVFAIVLLAMVIFTLQNDLKQIEYKDPLCIFRGYMGYVGIALQNYSYFLQALYRYITVSYPNRLFYQSTRFQFFVICLIWIWSFVGALPYIFLNEIIYNIDNQICQMPMKFSLITVYNALNVYLIPISSTIFIYFKLVQYVREMSKHVTRVNNLIRARRELKMVQRTVILVLVVTTVGFPYTTFVLMSFFTLPPKYHFRIAYISNDLSMAFLLITLFQLTEPLKTSIIKKIKRHTNTITPAIIIRHANF